MVGRLPFQLLKWEVGLALSQDSPRGRGSPPQGWGGGAAGAGTLPLQPQHTL